VLIEESIYESTLEKIKEIAGKYAYGSGNDHSPKGEVLQPIVSEAHLQVRRCAAGHTCRLCCSLLIVQSINSPLADCAAVY
jgi:hypothetical protein